MEVMVAVSPPPLPMDITAPSSPTRTSSSSSRRQLIDVDSIEDFEFDFSGNLQRPNSLSAADELFLGGKIRPLNLTNTNNFQVEIHKKKKLDSPTKPRKKQHNKRGRSPPQTEVITSATSSYCWSFLSSIWFAKGKGLKDPLRNYTVLSKTTEDAGNWSFRSIDTENSGSVSKRRVSAHELHYTVNRAASEELKKKTLLPYKHGLLGCLGFNNTAIYHVSSARFGSLERS